MVLLHVCFFYLIVDAKSCIEITFLHPKQLERIARSLLVHYNQFVTTTFTCSAVAMAHAILLLPGVCLRRRSLLFWSDDFLLIHHLRLRSSSPSPSTFGSVHPIISADFSKMDTNTGPAPASTIFSLYSTPLNPMDPNNTQLTATKS